MTSDLVTGGKLSLETLECMAEDLANLLRSHLDLPQQGVQIQVETINVANKVCVRIFAYTPEQGELFTVSVELQDPPPPGNLNLKSVFYK